MLEIDFVDDNENLSFCKALASHKEIRNKNCKEIAPMFTESFLDSAVVQVSYFLREHYVHSTGKEIKLRSSSCPQRTFRHMSGSK